MPPNEFDRDNQNLNIAMQFDGDTDPLTLDGTLASSKDIQAAAHKADRRIQNALSKIDNGGLLTDIIGVGGRWAPTGGPGGNGSRAADPRMTAKLMIHIGRQLGVRGLAMFGIEQTFLAKLNTPEAGRNWDPLYFVHRAIPFVHSQKPLMSDIQSPVDQKPGNYERMIEGQAKTSNPKDLITQNHRFASREARTKIPLLTKPERNIGLAGFQHIVNTSSPRTVGADSQDDSLMSKIDIIRGPEGVPIVELAMSIRNQYAPARSDQIGQGFTRQNVGIMKMEEVVDSIIDDLPSRGAFDESYGGVRRKRFTTSLSGMFTDKGHVLGKNVPTVQGSKLPQRKITTLEKSAFANGIIPMSFPGDDETGAIETNNKQRKPQDIIPDDVAYVPLSFTDMRPLSNENAFRTVYFRPIITSFMEDFGPQFNRSSYYGRSEDILVYATTQRSVALSFELHAFSPEDLQYMYGKLNWLTSMVYPEYDYELLLRSGPMCRMRIGDVIKGKTGLGLTGVIESLSYDYTDSIWELKKDSKVPRSIKVSLQFTVLHDVIIGRGPDGNFGGIGFVNAAGEFTTSPTSKTTTMLSTDAGAPGGIEVDTIQLNEVVTLPSAFRGFGVKKNG